MKKEFPTPEELNVQLKIKEETRTKEIIDLGISMMREKFHGPGKYYLIHPKSNLSILIDSFYIHKEKVKDLICKQVETELNLKGWNVIVKHELDRTFDWVIEIKNK